jgi:hypothetical protein
MKAAGLFAVGLVVAGTLLAATPARADEAEGRRRFRKGSELYEKGRYLDAAREFEAGYATEPRPLFLLNIGHAYRRANELVKAKTAYQKLLKLQPDFEKRVEVEGYIKSIDDALQAGDADVAKPTPANPAAAPPPPPPPPTLTLVDPNSIAASTPRAAPPPAPEPAASHPSIVETAPPPSDEPAASESVLRKPWFWVVVGAVVAGGIAAAVIVSRPSSSCPGTLCIKEMQ